MDAKSKTFRLAVIEQIRLLAGASLQVQFEKDVPGVCVPSELISGFCDDLFHPKSQIFLTAFIEDEIKDLALLYGLLNVASERMGRFHPQGVADLQKLPEWRAVMSHAKELAANLEGSSR